MNTITLNLKQPEYDEYFSTNELWQQQAAHVLAEHLERFGKQAAERISNKCRRNTSNNIHNAILVSGGRGTGKSVFLKNAEAIWENHAKAKNDLPNLYFTPLIDPTLLQDHDNFTNVLIAHIYNQVIYKLKSSQRHSSEYEINEKKFYDSLRKLAEAIEQPGDISEHTGLDKIIQYSSGIKIDKLFYEFVSSAKPILNCDAIVLPIDDVDMALSKAYSVLEEIRRRLSCPDIIPIVSGDLELYQHLVKLKLANDLNSTLPHNDKYIQFRDEKSKELSEAYVTKILPNQYRIALQPIEDLVSILTIQDPQLTPPNHNQSYQDYQHNLKRYFFGLINSEEKSADYPLPTSAREVGQLVRLLPPSKLCNTDSNKQLSLHDWESMRIWAEGKQHGASYVLARSAIQLLHKEGQPFGLNELMAFNMREQATERLSWAQYNFISEQEKAAEVFENTSNNFLLANTITDKILRSMPPLEMHTDNMSITGGNAKLDTSKRALIIYTNWAYYSTQGYQQRKIFFSRAFELLSTSLFMASSLKGINQSSDDIKKGWALLFRGIINKVPFHSIHALNPTKTVKENYSHLLDNGMDEESDSTEFNDQDILNFSNKLVDWAEGNKKIVREYITDAGHLIALLSAVFNKTFSQIHILRELYHKGENPGDQLVDAILRFRYILINAFGFFIKKEGVVQANIALETSKNTLREKNKFSNSSSTYKRNVGWIDTLTTNQENDNQQTKENKDSNEVAFLKAILSHPIFTHLDINIDNCVEVESALITNSSGNPRPRKAEKQNPSSSSISKRTKRPKRFKAITELVGRGKEFPDSTALFRDIKNGNFTKSRKKVLWEKLEAELDNNNLSEYPNIQVEIYSYLKSKKDSF